MLECGGKNPAVVLADAEELDLVAEHIVNAAFWNMGENCSANSRLIVHEDVKEELMQKILDRARDWRTGNPLDPKNNLGALVDKEHFDKVTSYLSQGEVILGGDSVDGCYVSPTIFDNVDPDHVLAREEIFGPVLSVITVKSTEEAITIANDTNYGFNRERFQCKWEAGH